MNAPQLESVSDDWNEPTPSEAVAICRGIMLAHDQDWIDEDELLAKFNEVWDFIGSARVDAAMEKLILQGRATVSRSETGEWMFRKVDGGGEDQRVTERAAAESRLMS